MIYAIVQFLSKMFFRIGFGQKVYGLEHIPREGAFLLAANHASHFDPPAIGCPLPRHICYFARKTLFKGFFAWVLPRLKTIPVDRDGDSDVSALKRVFKELNNGEALILFPEGTRTEDGNLQPAKRGVGMIACRTQVPVVPVRIYGSFEALSRFDKRPNFGKKITVVYGSPLDSEIYDPGKEAGKERYQIASERIMEAITALENPRAASFN
ncbi:MAG: 1-acyl-sn-glycerol-3-phosphate acyltransferase [Opitutales bacterium]|nr:1-acyl-sn-glycerol-3-phosphate acyltransferase [Opitutales bacterium]NRA26421.1 1-acyl-sn-glycerol-3-phosphate acyltransferase [Opitutales bacterium]